MVNEAGFLLQVIQPLQGRLRELVLLYWPMSADDWKFLERFVHLMTTRVLLCRNRFGWVQEGSRWLELIQCWRLFLLQVLETVVPTRICLTFSMVVLRPRLYQLWASYLHFEIPGTIVAAEVRFLIKENWLLYLIFNNYYFIFTGKFAILNYLTLRCKGTLGTIS